MNILRAGAAMIECSREEVAGVIDRLVEELLSAAGTDQPPVDTIRLARDHLRITVCLDRRQANRGRAQRTGRGRHIFLRPEPTRERHHWTVAHEIGEHLKAEILARLGISTGDWSALARESLANLFAYRLLVPSCWFGDDARLCDYDLLELKRRYATASHEVIAWRMLDLPEPCIITIVDNEHVSRRRSNAWPVTRQLTPIEKRCLRYVHESSRPKRMQTDGWTVTGWPVHQLDWYREILRTVVDEW